MCFSTLESTISPKIQQEQSLISLYPSFGSHSWLQKKEKKKQNARSAHQHLAHGMERLAPKTDSTRNPVQPKHARRSMVQIGSPQPAPAAVKRPTLHLAQSGRMSRY